jgi:hypothetical protein
MRLVLHSMREKLPKLTMTLKSRPVLRVSVERTDEEIT